MKKILYTLFLLSLFLSVFIMYTTENQAKTMNSIIWDVTLNCHESGGTYDFVIFGEAPDAYDGPPADSYDTAKPPAPPSSPYVRIWLNDSLPPPYTFLWKDYRWYPDTEKMWNVTVQWIPSSGSSPTLVTLHWDVNEFSASEYTLIYLCDDTGSPLKNMLLNNTHCFDCAAYLPQKFKITCTLNLPPATPKKPSGETSGKIGIEYTYTSSTIDPNNHNVYYQWNWGDGMISDWFGPCTSGQMIQTTHTWTKNGDYQIQVRAKDIYGAETNWSDPLFITMPVYQKYKIDDIFSSTYFFIRFLKDTYVGMTFIQTLRTEECFSLYQR